MNNTEIDSNEDQLEWLDDTLIHQSEASFIKYFRSDIGKVSRLESRDLFEDFTDKDFILPDRHNHSVYAVENKHIVFLYLVATEMLTEIEEETIEKLNSLPKLQFLCLNICKIPINFPILPDLEKLFLLSASIKPDTIFKDLYALEDLYIIDSSMPKLPDSLYKFPLLSHLEISIYQDTDKQYFKNNCLTEIPHEIGNLQGLWELHIHNTSMKEIPNTIGELEKLRVLYLTNCDLPEIPKSVGNLSNLETLSLTGNKLSFLPESIFFLKNLKELVINYNSFKTLSSKISNLINLEKISFFENPLSSLPVEFNDLPFLKRIFLDPVQRKLLTKNILEKEKKGLIKIL